MRPLTIDLDHLASALTKQQGDFRLDLLSGRLLDIPPAGEDPEIERLLAEEPERLLALEPLSNVEHLALMEDFLCEVVDPDAYAALTAAMAERRQQRAFLNALHQFPRVRAAWQLYEHERLRDLALDWLADNQLEPK